MMAFSFGNPQHSVVTRAIDALQRLQNDPQQLAHEREQRYNEPPPPYSESGETTQPPTPGPPGPPVVDESYQRELRRLDRYKSTPLNQFESQAKRERDRLVYQITEERFGRRQTLPFDDSSDLQANSENNVRSRWVEQGIWGDEWGPAWPKDSHPMSRKWEYRGGGPFFGPYNPTSSKFRPGARWGHEEPDPEPESESESEPEPESEQEPRPIFGIFASSQRKQPKPQPQPIGYIQTAGGLMPRYPIPIPTVRNSEASRPYRQFSYQISKEREWLKDELVYKAPGTHFDLDAMAYQSVKDHWIKDKVWNSKWDDTPGMTWIYEEPEEEEPVEAPAASDATGEQPQDTADHSGQQVGGPRYVSLFGSAPIPTVAIDGGSAPAPEDAEASHTERQTSGRMREAPSLCPAVTHGEQGSENAPRRSPRIAMLSRAKQAVSSAPCQSKRHRCPDTAEDKQPPKRLRHNGRDLVLSHNAPDAVDANKPYDSSASVTKGVVNAKMAASTGGETGGKRIRAVFNPIRRSARVAERESKRKAIMAEELPSRSTQTKKSKGGHPKRR